MKLTVITSADGSVAAVVHGHLSEAGGGDVVAGPQLKLGQQVHEVDIPEANESLSAGELLQCVGRYVAAQGLA
ncbi:hypothetical protein [Streptomyces luteireticuli]|uniref:Uncharacterized protein n=1 Tax=Streptomyces luteireticuli TaxID=173858 RepID=A0ABP3ITU5_9ACTN